MNKKGQFFANTPIIFITILLVIGIIFVVSYVDKIIENYVGDNFGDENIQNNEEINFIYDELFLNNLLDLNYENKGTIKELIFDEKIKEANNGANYYFNKLYNINEKNKFRKKDLLPTKINIEYL